MSKSIVLTEVMKQIAGLQKDLNLTIKLHVHELGDAWTRIKALEDRVGTSLDDVYWNEPKGITPTYAEGLEHGRREGKLEYGKGYKDGMDQATKKANQDADRRIGVMRANPPVMSVNEIAKYIQANYNNEQTTNILSFFAQDLRKLPNGDINPNSEYSKGYDAGVEECKKALSHV